MTAVASAITRFFANATDPILFAGAGVSARAGVATWGKLLSELGEWIRSKDPLTFHQMGEYIAQQDFLAAADYFFLSKKVTDGERFETLVSHLSRYSPDPISELIQLPFNGFVTTNFDRCLLDAFARCGGKAAHDFRRGDESFKQVLWCLEPFVARIHGAVEFAPSIVLTTAGFESVGQDAVYRDLLGNLVTRRNVLFVGCSFADPAVQSVFNSINREYGSTTLGRHMALVPDNASSDFMARLSRLNVEAVRYSAENNHQEMWDGISLCLNEMKAKGSSDNQSNAAVLDPFLTAKRYLASCYARTRLSGRIHPLREAVIEGVVSSVIQSHAPKGVLLSDVVESVHQELGVSKEVAHRIVTENIDKLADEKLCLRHKVGDAIKVSWRGELDTGGLTEAISFLTKSAVDRAIVQEGLRPGTDVVTSLGSFFKEMVLQRGWDLGAAYASNRCPEDVDIEKLLFKCCPFLSHREIEGLERVVTKMLLAPTDAEARVLADIGRASFALELVLQSPRNSLFHGAVLPQKVYVDANVLMPALTYGHPYHEIYRQTISRLRDAANKSGGGFQIVAFYGFLNEIVSHRRLALEDIAQRGKNYKEGVVKEAIFYGTTNMNVFVGAYANVAQSKPDLEFADFLKQYAPYTNEKELQQWIVHRGVEVQSDAQMRTAEFANISYELQKAYSSALAAGKGPHLIEHDAVQLSTLFTDQSNGRRSILVTADKKLREVILKGKYRTLADCMVTNIGLTQLIDLLIGNSGEVRALSSLLWGAKTSSKTEEVRQYLTTIALQEYDEAMAMEMPFVVEEIAESVVLEAERLGIRMDSDNATDRQRMLQLLEPFEEKFFEAIRERIEVREGRLN